MVRRQRDPDANLRRKGFALLEALDQMIADTAPIFAEMELLRGRPYTGRTIGVELEAFRAALREGPRLGSMLPHD